MQIIVLVLCVGLFQEKLDRKNLSRAFKESATTSLFLQGFLNGLSRYVSVFLNFVDRLSLRLTTTQSFGTMYNCSRIVHTKV